MKKEFRNRKHKSELMALLKEETFQRRTVSFYRYVKLSNLKLFRDHLYDTFSGFNIFGRIYLSAEGINAQVSVPIPSWGEFADCLYSYPAFSGMEFKVAVEDNGKSFYKLIIKIRNKIVADGIDDPSFDPSNTGAYLSAEGFNAYLSKPGTIVVDMRNHYESEVGRFENAFCPDADTFKEELPIVLEHLKGEEQKNVLMYCTGGIRCEKASAYLKHKGFQHVFHLKGGIIQYASEIRDKGLPSKFKGKNFVFDERIGERITDDIISNCHQCEELCDQHVNCKYDDCHLLFIQCTNCAQKFEGCCSQKCMEFAQLPVEIQRKMRKGKNKGAKETHSVYKSRLRPKLKEISTDPSKP